MGFHFHRAPGTEGDSKHFAVFLGPNYVQLHRMVGASADNETVYNFTRQAGHEYNIRVVQAGSNIKVFVDGVLYINNSDPENTTFQGIDFTGFGGLAFRTSGAGAAYGGVN